MYRILNSNQTYLGVSLVIRCLYIIGVLNLATSTSVRTPFSITWDIRDSPPSFRHVTPKEAKLSRTSKNSHVSRVDITDQKTVHLRPTSKKVKNIFNRIFRRFFLVSKNMSEIYAAGIHKNFNLNLSH